MPAQILQSQKEAAPVHCICVVFVHKHELCALKVELRGFLFHDIFHSWDDYKVSPPRLFMSFKRINWRGEYPSSEVAKFPRPSPERIDVSIVRIFELAGISFFLGPGGKSYKILPKWIKYVHKFVALLLYRRRSGVHE